MEQLRQQQLELAKAPVAEIQALIPKVAAVLTPTPAAQTEEAASPLEGTNPRATEGEGEGGDLPLGAGTGGAEVEVPETKTGTDEVAADGQSVTVSVQGAGQDSEESRKRRESMKNNAEQVW